MPISASQHQKYLEYHPVPQFSWKDDIHGPLSPLRVYLTSLRVPIKRGCIWILVALYFISGSQLSTKDRLQVLSSQWSSSIYPCKICPESSKMDPRVAKRSLPVEEQSPSCPSDPGPLRSHGCCLWQRTPVISSAPPCSTWDLVQCLLGNNCFSFDLLILRSQLCLFSSCGATAPFFAKSWQNEIVFDILSTTVITSIICADKRATALAATHVMLIDTTLREGMSLAFVFL